MQLPAAMRTLVIVDDEPRVVEALDREIGYLYGQGAIAVRGFTDPHECVNYLSRNPDEVFLVVSDVRMPGMSGGSLATEVRKLCPGTQIVLLTAYPDVPEIQKAVASDLQGLLLKPWTRETLKAEIDKAARTVATRMNTQKKQSELEEQLGLAGRFQQAVLATDLNVSDAVKIDVSYQPVEHTRCGGDYYEVIGGEGGEVAVVLGDVAGHGFRAALVTGSLKAMVRSYMLMHHGAIGDPATLLGYLNDELCRLFERAPEMLLALTIVVLSPETGQARLVVAGQPPAFLLRGTSVERLSTGSPALGFVSGLVFESRVVKIGPGDRLVLITDGAIESVREASRLGWDQVERLLLGEGTASAAHYAELFRQAGGGRRFSDDVTVVVVDMRGP